MECVSHQMFVLRAPGARAMSGQFCLASTEVVHPEFSTGCKDLCIHSLVESSRPRRPDTG